MLELNKKVLALQKVLPLLFTSGGACRGRRNFGKVRRG
jgi:hypothetical protein